MCLINNKNKEQFKYLLAPLVVLFCAAQIWMQITVRHIRRMGCMSAAHRHQPKKIYKFKIIKEMDFNDGGNWTLTTSVGHVTSNQDVSTLISMMLSRICIFEKQKIFKGRKNSKNWSSLFVTVD